MTASAPGLFVGKVVHRRLRPIAHQLNYTVASVLVDVDHLDALPTLLHYNRPSLFSLNDRDFGPLENAKPLPEFAWSEMREHDTGRVVTRIMVLCYPRLLGYTFNPLTVYYGLDANDHVRMVLYEVHNTFGARHIYVAGPFAAGDMASSAADKVFRVSPFNRIEGSYSLKASPPTNRVAVGVALSTREGPLLNAYFTGERHPLTNATLLRIFFTIPLMTFKVMAGIHWEALKLWAKGLKLQSP
jgi:uncharacterized protein